MGRYNKNKRYNIEEGINLFLSHTSKDKPIVRRVADDLESLGLNIWLDEKKIIAGDSITDKLSDGLSKYDVFLIFLSEKSVNAPWVKEELRVALNKRIKTEGKLKIIPVILEECQIPVFLEDYVYVNLSDPNNYFDAISFLSDSIIFNDQLFSQYIKYHPGYGLVEELKIDAKISGDKQDIAIINEHHLVKSFKNTNKYIKKVTLDGELIDVAFNKGSIDIKQISKSDFELDLTLEEPFQVGKVSDFEIILKTRNEFIYENSWFYSIESPTKKLSAKFSFEAECNIHDFCVKHLRALGEIDTDLTSNIKSAPGTRNEFQCDIKFPSYRDRYKFHWS